MDGIPKRRGRPPKAESEAVLTKRFQTKAESEAVLTKRFQTMLDPDTHAWVLAHGGGAYIRRLVEEDRKHEANNNITTTAPENGA
jgi:hypothetical protein